MKNTLFFTKVFNLEDSIKLYKEFQETLKTTINPYGNGYASKKIVEILKNVDLKNILKKSFYDLRG